MTPETIKLIGSEIVQPICVILFLMFIFYSVFDLIRKNKL